MRKQDPEEYTNLNTHSHTRDNAHALEKQHTRVGVHIKDVGLHVGKYPGFSNPDGKPN